MDHEPEQPQPPTGPDDSEPTYPTAPPVERTAAPEPLYTVDLDLLDQPPPPERFQFSLAEMLLLTAIAAAGLSVLGLLPDGYTATNAAGFTGIVVLVSLIVLVVLKPERLIVHVAWWLLFLTYLGACVAAVLSQR